MKNLLLINILLNIVLGQKKPLSPEALVTLPRTTYDAISPNGQNIIYSTSQYKKESNKKIYHRFLYNVSTGKSTNLTETLPSDFYNPIWLNDNEIGYIANNNDTAQFWSINVKDTSDTPIKQLTNFAYESIDNAKYHPESKLLTFTTENELEKKEDKFDSALIYEQLYVRHWDEWKDYSVRSHLHAVPLNDKVPESGKNLMKETPKSSTPISPFGDSGDYAISPDGKEAAFLTRPDSREIAWKTTLELYIVPTDGSKAPVKINDKGLGALANPTYSPDGKYLAWLEIIKDNNESDRNHIVLYDRSTKKKRYLFDSWDLSAGSIEFTSDSKSLILDANHVSKNKLFKLDIETEKIKELTQTGSASVVQINDKDLIFQKSRVNQPAELYSVNLDGSNEKRLTSFNIQAYEPYQLQDTESFWFKGALDEVVHGLIVKPVNFQEGKKYPVAFWVHGGPESAWGDSFGYRWNPQIPASAGYAVIMINFHGSTGYGQKFTDSIFQNYGGYPYEDLMKGYDYALHKYQFLDDKRSCAWGASYGGYMVNWLNGHTDRFNCLIGHDGTFDTYEDYFTTDETFFNESEFGGPAWNYRDIVERWNPMNTVHKWNTPTLLIHGGKDYRCVSTDGLAAFTALQRRGVPSRFLYFPDENHWVSKPANQLRWFAEKIQWANKWTNNTSPYQI